MTASTQLVWLRHDLRVMDNPALHDASQHGPVTAVITLTPKQWQQHDRAPVQVDLLLRHLKTLQQALGESGISLKVCQVDDFAAVPEALLALARQLKITHLRFNDQYEWDERIRDDAVETAFQAAGYSVHRYLDQTLFAPGQLLTGQGDYYTVFTPFYKRWLSRLPEVDLTPLPAPTHQSGPVEHDPLPTQLPGWESPIASTLWPAGCEHALARLDHFVDEHLIDYDTQRDLPAVEGTSTLSPYLALGAVSIRQCLQAVMAHTQGQVPIGKDGPGRWVAELVWREFYRHIMVGFPRVCRYRAFKVETERLTWREDPEGLSRWQAGQTGFPLVDAAMRQLVQTGWMHNRLRMLTAMFLSKHLLIDWRLGEQFFMQHLVDGDLAANNGGWQWAASTGTDAAPYFRLFNPYRQSERFDPQGEFIRKFVPELHSLSNKSIHQPPTSQADQLNYPQPCVDLKEARDRVMHAFDAIKTEKT